MVYGHIWELYVYAGNLIGGADKWASVKFYADETIGNRLEYRLFEPENDTILIQPGKILTSYYTVK